MQASFNAKYPHFPLATSGDNGDSQDSIDSSGTGTALLLSKDEKLRDSVGTESVFQIPEWFQSSYAFFKHPREQKFNTRQKIALELIMFFGGLAVSIVMALVEIPIEPYTLVDSVITISLYVYIFVTYLILIVEERVLKRESTDAHDRSKYVWKYNYSQVVYWLFYMVVAVLISSLTMEDDIVVKRMGVAFRVFFSFATFSVFIKQSTLNNRIFQYLSNPKNVKSDIWFTRTVQSYLDVASLGMFYVYTTYQVSEEDYLSYSYVLYLCFIFLFNLVNSIEVTANANAIFVSEYMQTKGIVDYRVKVFNYVVMHELVLVTILGILNKMVEVTQANQKLYQR